MSEFLGSSILKLHSHRRELHADSHSNTSIIRKMTYVYIIHVSATMSHIHEYDCYMLSKFDFAVDRLGDHRNRFRARKVVTDNAQITQSIDRKIKL
jgi:hypothetical protein